MKTLLLAALCYLLTLTAQAQIQPWPRNPKTGKVEFSGTLPWPSTAKTDAQRRALVRRWYLAKLTDETAQAISEGARTAASPTLLTYDKLPIAPVLRYGSGPGSLLLGYIIMLKPSADKGLAYNFFEFSCTIQGGDGAQDLDSSLEEMLGTQNEQAALAQLRKRLAVAVAGW